MNEQQLQVVAAHELTISVDVLLCHEAHSHGHALGHVFSNWPLISSEWALQGAQERERSAASKAPFLF